MKRVYSNKSQLNSPKNNIKGKDSELSRLQKKYNLKYALMTKNEDQVREKELSPYATSIFSSVGRLPLFQASVNRIKVFKSDKVQKKNSTSKGK